MEGFCVGNRAHTPLQTGIVKGYNGICKLAIARSNLVYKQLCWLGSTGQRRQESRDVNLLLETK